MMSGLAEREPLERIAREMAEAMCSLPTSHDLARAVREFGAATLAWGTTVAEAAEAWRPVEGNE